MALELPVIRNFPNGALDLHTLRRVLEGHYLELLRLQGQVIAVADTGVGADTEFAVTHDLRIVPSLAEALINTSSTSSAYVQIRPSGTAWTATTIYLKCNTANAALLVRVRK